MEHTYTTLWRGKGLFDDAETIDDMIAALEAATAELRALRDAGVRLADRVADDYAHLVTTDPAVAERYGFEEEEPWEDDEGFDAGMFGSNGRLPE